MAPTRQKKTAKIVEPPSSSEAEYDQSQPDASQSQSQEIPADTLKNFLDKTKQQVRTGSTMKLLPFLGRHVHHSFEAAHLPAECQAPAEA